MGSGRLSIFDPDSIEQSVTTALRFTIRIPFVLCIINSSGRFFYASEANSERQQQVFCAQEKTEGGLQPPPPLLQLLFQKKIGIRAHTGCEYNAEGDKNNHQINRLSHRKSSCQTEKSYPRSSYSIAKNKMAGKISSFSKLRIIIRIQIIVSIQELPESSDR